jgi:hypothetical protein
VKAQDRRGGADRSGLAVLEQELAKLRRHVDQLRLTARQLRALRQADADIDAQIARLEQTLNFDEAIRHVHDAVGRGELFTDPIPHLLLTDLLPSFVYDAVVGAIPDPVFFKDVGPDSAELRLPPRLAPTHSIVAWAFVTEIVLQVLGPALVTRLSAPLDAFATRQFPELPPLSRWHVEITLSEGRLVRSAGVRGQLSSGGRPWDVLTTIMSLAPLAGIDETSTVLELTGDALSVPGSMLREDAPKRVSLGGNAALTMVGAARACRELRAAGAASGARCMYEFGVGPTQEGRRMLDAMILGRRHRSVPQR